jgi:hypothetical protein
MKIIDEVTGTTIDVPEDSHDPEYWIVEEQYILAIAWSRAEAMRYVLERGIRKTAEIVEINA